MGSIISSKAKMQTQKKVTLLGFKKKQLMQIKEKEKFSVLSLKMFQLSLKNKFQ